LKLSSEHLIPSVIGLIIGTFLVAKNEKDEIHLSMMLDLIKQCISAPVVCLSSSL
jgi:hypothetical protein